MITTKTASGPNEANIQGMIVRGFTHPYSCHMIFQFGSKTGAKGFIKAIFPYIQSGASWGNDKPDMMINIGLTFNGIKTASDLDDTYLGYFPNSFTDGPTSAGSQGSLNDWGPSDPSGWAFGNDTDEQHVDCIVHAYATSDDMLEQLVAIIASAAHTGGLTEFFPIANGTKRLEEYALMPRNVVHFGYLDGIDQPSLVWNDPPDPNDTEDLRNFLIGYPLSTAGPGPAGDNPAGNFAKDGCYNAFRMLEQDVKKFDDFLVAHAPKAPKEMQQTPEYAQEWIAAKLNGRWRNGSPLELSPNGPDPKTSQSTVFGYSGDTAGMKCPFAAHNRVANPRDEVLNASEPSPVPRLLRRGMPYGAPPTLTNYDGERGLIGLFLCGSIATQFELLYSWINTTNFAGSFTSQNGQDALVANREIPGADNSYSIPTAGGPVAIKSLPQFVVTRGTAYCLLPSISTLKSIAGL